MAINAGDTAWVLISAALVMFMTPGLGFFYGGLVRQKNVLSTVMHSFFVLCLISVQWVLWGYTLAFGPDVHGLGLIGSLAWFGLNGVGLTPDPDYAPTIPHEAFMVFQMMFAVITPALITGAFAERKRFKAFVLFSLLWATLVYDPIAHWVWGQGGWLHKMGVLDFAGGTVVEIASGSSALVAAWVLGKRILHAAGEEAVEPHDVTMVVLGTAMLWFGWFGFNAGSALAANGIAVAAFVNTNVSGAMGALTWLTLHWLHRGRPSVIGATAGAVVGLVAITPAAGYVPPAAAILIGLIGATGCYCAVQLRDRLNVDDALDVWAFHGVAGVIGLLCTGVFAAAAVNPIASGLFDGNPRQLGIEALAAVAVWAYASVMTYVCLRIVNLFVPLRVSEAEEAMGLDASEHAEIAYVR